MNIEPVITEKTLKLAKGGLYTFRVGKEVTKNQVKKLISEIFAVSVVSVRTLNEKPKVKRGLSGRKRIIGASKKALVTLKEKQKIDLFEESKK